MLVAVVPWVISASCSRCAAALHIGFDLSLFLFFPFTAWHGLDACEMMVSMKTKKKAVEFRQGMQYEICKLKTFAGLVVEVFR
jgi:hypothetical protein